MARIFEKEWESIKDYDEQLKQVSHYKVHPEMMPFIGRNYPKARILLLGESHYVSPNDRERIQEDWYDNPVDKTFKEPWWFNTRIVINNFLCGRRTKAHSMFRNPAKALIEAWGLEKVNDSEAFTSFAFMNYFQRPAVNKGKSIQANEDDVKYARNNLKEVVEIIKPEKVVFLSKKAFYAFSGSGVELEGVDIEWTNHPTSKYWNSSNGKEKLEKIFKKISERPNFIPDGELDYEKVYRVLSKRTEPYFMLKKRENRFKKDRIGVRVYDADNGTKASEVAWYFVEDGKRIGIGYVANARFLWIWDYDQRDYLSERTLSSKSKQILNDFRESIISLPD